jgi:hypothetical protein
MKVIVGGVERDISQVKTFVMYGGKVETVGQVLADSRADRLMKKEFQKQTVSNILSLSEGSYQSLPDLARVDPEILASKVDVVRKAKKIEKKFAKN